MAGAVGERDFTFYASKENQVMFCTMGEASMF